MSVSIVDDWRRQLRVLDSWHTESMAARARFDAARDRYQQQIRQAQNLGYMGDYVDQLDQRYREFSSQMDQILQTLLNGEVRIAHQTERLHGLIADAMRQD